MREQVFGDLLIFNFFGVFKISFYFFEQFQVCVICIFIKFIICNGISSWIPVLQNFFYILYELSF